MYFVRLHVAGVLCKLAQLPSRSEVGTASGACPTFGRSASAWRSSQDMRERADDGRPSLSPQRFQSF